MNADLTDLEAEQAYINRAYECLARMRKRTEALDPNVSDDPLAMKFEKARRLFLLADNGRALCFGRIDEATGEVWYIGRRHVEDDAGDPVVVEWRTPVAVPYYRAS